MWDWAARLSVFTTLDFDAQQGHKNKKSLSPEKLASLEQQLRLIQEVEVRRSKGGLGIHAIVYAPPGIASSNHTVHARRAQSVVAWLSKRLGFDLTPYVDCFGGNAWIYARETGQNGFELLKESEGSAPAEAWTIPEPTPTSAAVKTATPAETPLQRLILDELLALNALNGFNGQMGYTHTADLRTVAERRGLPAIPTVATGVTRPGDKPNCQFWLADEGLLVERLNNVVEAKPKLMKPRQSPKRLRRLATLPSLRRTRAMP